MKKEIGNGVIELVQWDITKEETAAIVNAANSSLLGGGGVDGAIHRAGGPEILEECRKIGGCPPGEARITTAGRMKAKYVIHTVGPIYRGGSSGEREILSNVYRNSLTLAAEKGIKSIAFPSISTGAYGYPIEEAARTALATVADFLKSNDAIETVRLVLFSDRDFGVYSEVLEGI